MKRLLCFFLGHRWRILSAACHRAITLAHLHTRAGMDARCDRCGEEWMDRCAPCRTRWPDPADAFRASVEMTGWGDP